MALIRRFQPRMVGTHLLQGLVEDLLLSQQCLVSLHAGLEICLEAAAGGGKKLRKLRRKGKHEIGNMYFTRSAKIWGEIQYQPLSC